MFFRENSIAHGQGQPATPELSRAKLAHGIAARDIDRHCCSVARVSDAFLEDTAEPGNHDFDDRHAVAV